MPASIDCVVGKLWLHSYEEDTATFRVYRRDTYEFPPARGRVGFVLNPRGAAVYHGIARGDGTDEIPARWQDRDPDFLTIVLEQGQARSLEFVLLHCDDTILRVRK